MENLRYRGDLTERIDQDHILGPDMHRRYLLPRKVAYDRAKNQTVVTLRGVLPAELKERIAPLIEQQRERERIRRVFCG